ncbi:MAG TPA: RIP metalloprotease RseP, partial [Candidatus Limnocylindrales bacterium]|nr:RIP metalloprotease RseP [Candidatus Limnocylindrales bacterium]
IFVHELGHFWAAKAVGIEVQRFSIGLGPKVFGFKSGETEYVLSLIPLGGYVKMGGMDDEVMEKIEGGAVEGRAVEGRPPSDRDFDTKPIWARTLVISAGVIMNMLFAFVSYSFVAVQYGIPDYATTRIGRVVAESLPPGTEDLASVEPGSRVVRIGEREVDNWGDLVTGLYEATPGPVTIALVDVAREVEIDVPADEEARRALATSINPWIDAGVGTTVPGSPADEAGLEPGDRITAVAGVPVGSWWDVVAEIESRPGERVEMTISRSGRELIRAVSVDAEEEERNGETVVVGRIGIYQPNPETMYTEASLGEAIVHGYRETVAVTGLILGFLRDLMTGGVSPRSVGSIVTIGEASGQAAQAGFDQFIRFMALFSINLAILNLLPIPVLDGGHLLFLAIEAVRGGRGLTAEQRLAWSNVGFLIIVGIILWALGNDFLRLLGL